MVAEVDQRVVVVVDPLQRSGRRNRRPSKPCSLIVSADPEGLKLNASSCPAPGVNVNASLAVDPTFSPTCSVALAARMPVADRNLQIDLRTSSCLLILGPCLALEPSI